MHKPPMICLLIAVLILSACVRLFIPAAKQTAIPDKNEIHPELANIPIYPDSPAWTEGMPGMDRSPKKLKTYSYVANVFKYETLMEFYKENMTGAGWELFQEGQDSKTKSADLMFSKNRTVAHLQIIPWTANSYLVSVVFYDEPALE